MQHARQAIECRQLNKSVLRVAGEGTARTSRRSGRGGGAVSRGWRAEQGLAWGADERVGDAVGRGGEEGEGCARGRNVFTGD